MTPPPYPESFATPQAKSLLKNKAFLSLNCFIKVVEFAGRIMFFALVEHIFSGLAHFRNISSIFTQEVQRVMEYRNKIRFSWCNLLQNTWNIYIALKVCEFQFLFTAEIVTISATLPRYTKFANFATLNFPHFITFRGSFHLYVRFIRSL